MTLVGTPRSTLTPTQLRSLGSQLMLGPTGKLLDHFPGTLPIP